MFNDIIMLHIVFLHNFIYMDDVLTYPKHVANCGF